MSDESTTYEQKLAEEKQRQELQQLEQLDNTHARIAASRSDICPKLLIKEVDMHSITRQQEHLPLVSCDYYVYPEVGDRLMAVTNNDQLELLLIAPQNHNFANGSIVAESDERYIIRAKYNGIQMQPDDVVYDLTVTFN